MCLYLIPFSIELLLYHLWWKTMHRQSEPYSLLSIPYMYLHGLMINCTCNYSLLPCTISTKWMADFSQYAMQLCKWVLQDMPFSIKVNNAVSNVHSDFLIKRITKRTFLPKVLKTPQKVHWQDAINLYHDILGSGRYTSYDILQIKL